MNARAFLLSLLLFPVLATASEQDSTVSGQVLLHEYSGDGNYLAQEAYVEFAPNGTIGVWVSGYHANDFKSVYVGAARNWESGWAAGLGVGNAWYDNTKHVVVNPWLYFESDEWEFLLNGERYMGDTVNPWFVRGYLQRRVGERWLLGAYGETDLGIGPAATFKVNDHLAMRVVIPVAGRGDTNVLATLVITF